MMISNTDILYVVELLYGEAPEIGCIVGQVVFFDSFEDLMINYLRKTPYIPDQIHEPIYFKIHGIKGEFAEKLREEIPTILPPKLIIGDFIYSTPTYSTNSILSGHIRSNHYAVDGYDNQFNSIIQEMMNASDKLSSRRRFDLLS